MLRIIQLGCGSVLNEALRYTVPPTSSLRYDVTVVCLSFVERGDSAKLRIQGDAVTEKVKRARCSFFQTAIALSKGAIN